MNQYIHIPFAIALLIAVAWTTLFSLTNRPGIRRRRVRVSVDNRTSLARRR
jgi:hypothetical protein